VDLSNDLAHGWIMAYELRRLRLSVEESLDRRVILS
jgi:hypothetical protein